MVTSALTAAGADPDAVARDAVASGEVSAVLLGDTRMLALSENVSAEQDVADAVGQLAEEGRLAVVLGSGPHDGPEPVITDAHLLGSEALARRLEDADPDSVVTVMGDPDLLGPIGLGAPVRDLVAAVHDRPGLVPVADLRSPAAVRGASGSPVTELVAGVRQGRLPTVAADHHEVAVVPAPDDRSLATRVEQLVHDSIPRVFGVTAEEIAVVTPLRGGACGTTALAERLEGAAQVRLVHEAQPDRWPAVVAVYPAQAAGVLSRPLVLTGLTRAGRHVSVAVGQGCEVATAVSQVGHRPRWTLLPSLLAAMWSSESGTHPA